MTGYTPKQPTHYQYPYKQMLADYEGLIDQYKTRREITPNYIIINPEDIDSLLREMAAAKMIPAGHLPGKLQYQGIRIIKSPDMPKGFFDVAGN